MWTSSGKFNGLQKRERENVQVTFKAIRSRDEGVRGEEEEIQKEVLKIKLPSLSLSFSLLAQPAARICAIIQLQLSSAGIFINKRDKTAAEDEQGAAAEAAEGATKAVS